MLSERMRYKRSHIVCFHSYEISRIDKSVETENRSVLGGSWGAVGMGSDGLVGVASDLGERKVFGTR